MGTKGKLTVIAVLMSGIVALLVWSKNGDRKKTPTPQNAVTNGNGAIDPSPGGDEPGNRVIENADPMHSPTGGSDGSIPTETAGTHNEQPAPQVADNTPPPVRPDPPAQSDRTYTVAAGDSLWKIAQKVYGKGTEGRRIFDANRDKMSSEDDFLRVGTVLAIPALPEAVKPPVPETVDAGVAPKSPAPVAAKTYKVKAGDTLSSIAKSTLGDGNKWKDIFKANKDKLAHPDSLTEGMELSIPETR